MNNTLYTVNGVRLVNNALFGQRTGQADPRIMQLAVKLSF